MSVCVVVSFIPFCVTAFTITMDAKGDNIVLQYSDDNSDMETQAGVNKSVSVPAAIKRRRNNVEGAIIMNTEEDNIVVHSEKPLLELDDSVLDELQYREETPIKRRQNNVEEPLEEPRKQVKRKLFTETTSVSNVREMTGDLKTLPTLDHFVYGDEVLDLRCPLPGHLGASVILTNVFNTFMYIVRYKSTLLSLQNRKLAIQLRTAEHYLRQLEDSRYDNAHIILPRLVESLFTMLDHRHNTIYINQLKPISCVLNKRFLMENFTFRSMEATSKNDSNYIELVFNNPFRFVFAGCAKRGGLHNQNEVNLFPFFGDYINKAIDDMYEVLYELVSKEIKKAKKELKGLDQAVVDKKQLESDSVGVEVPQTQAANDLRSMQNYSQNKNSVDTRLANFLRAVELPLSKKETVDILITSGNSGKQSSSSDTSKMCYLTVEEVKDGNDRYDLKMVNTDVTEDSIYLSSYIRCRVLLLEQAKFGLQIYTRHAIKLLTIDDRLVKFDELFTNTAEK